MPRKNKFTTGVCGFCLCTDENCAACIERTGEPCRWVNEEHTLCSACELPALQQVLADEGAVSDIESYTVARTEKGKHWYDTSSATDEDKRRLGAAVRYLELRGILVRHKKDVEWVSFSVNPWELRHWL